MIGQRLLHYEIVEKLGEGGMGVVYKARDTHLDRFVAIKVLPAEKVADPERKRRFIQEAKTASALNHPGIITIHDISQANGTDFIVMEYVPGKTLDQLIPRRGMRLSDALKCAVEIAEALAAAHGAGIVHRDLKPGNVMVNDQGRAKTLDFGLAKLTETTESDDEAPTETLKPATEEGTILGTVAYMSPEQAQGRHIDARSDIFSFGSMLYEMITGRRAFQGDSKMSTLAAIIERDPAPLPPEIPGELERLITRCLRKDPARRLQTMSDLKVALEELKEESDSGKLTATQATPRAGWRRSVVLPIAAFTVVIVAGVYWFTWWRGKEVEPPLVTAMFTTDPGLEGWPSFSPDGTAVAYTRLPEDSSRADIYVKMLGVERPVPLTEPRGFALSPDWSPDGRSIAFVRVVEGKGSAWLVPRIGGAERKLGDVDGPRMPDRAISWTPDGRALVVVDRENPQEPSGLFLLSAETGQKTRLTLPPPGIIGDTGGAIAPDGSSLVFSRRVRWGVGDLYRLDLGPDLRPRGEPRKLTSGVAFANWPAWTPDGRSIVFCSGYMHTSTLWRVRADGSTKPAPLPFVGQGSYCPAIARQGNRLVYMKHVWDTDIWRLDLAAPDRAAGPPRVLIRSTLLDEHPRYSPNGRRIVFRSERSGKPELWSCDADGSNPKQLTSSGANQGRWSSDSERLAFMSEAEGNPEIYVVGADGGPPQRLANHPAADDNPRWSPDDKWIYFSSDRTGTRQVWKVPAGGGEAVLASGERLGPQWFDGKYVYSAREDSFRVFSLWQEPVEGGERKRILDSLTRAEVAVTSRGIYCIAREGPDASWFLRFRDSATGKTSTLAPVKRGTAAGLAVSPDGKSVLYTQVDRETADLVLVENFR